MENLTNKSCVDTILIKHGSTLFLDWFKLVVIFSISLVGLVLNVFGSYILSTRPGFSSNMYKYLRINCISGALKCFLCMLNCSSTSYRAVSWSNTFWVQAYYIYVFLPIGSTLYFFSGILEVYCLADRVGNFESMARNYVNRIPAYKRSVFVFVLCSLVNMPYFFYYRPTLEHFNRCRWPDGSNMTLWTIGLTDFGHSNLGFGLVIFVYVIRDFGVVVLHLFFNIVSIVLVKKYLKRKKQVMSETVGNVSLVVLPNTVTHNGQRVSAPSSSELRIIFMVVAMVVLSTIEHTVFLAANIYSHFSHDLTLYTLLAFVDIYWPLKRTLDILILFFFNKVFRLACLDYFRTHRLGFF